MTRVFSAVLALATILSATQITIKAPAPTVQMIQIADDGPLPPPPDPDFPPQNV